MSPLSKKKLYTLLKMLTCDMNAQGAQRQDSIFILWYISLKVAVLLHKTVLVNFPMATIAIWFWRHDLKFQTLIYIILKETSRDWVRTKRAECVNMRKENVLLLESIWFSLYLIWVCVTFIRFGSFWKFESFFSAVGYRNYTEVF